MIPPTSFSRALLLACAGIAAFLLAFQASRSGSSAPVVDAVIPRRPSPADASVMSRTAHRPPDRSGSPGSRGRAAIAESVTRDPFAPVDWGAPPPSGAPAPTGPAAAGKPRGPAATPPPDMPLRFIGRIERPAGPPVAFLMDGEMLFMAHVGDVIEHRYRVDAFDAGKVVVTEVPHMQRRTIPIAGT